MEGLDGKVTIFHMAHKGDLRQVQALIQDDPRYLCTYLRKHFISLDLAEWCHERVFK